MTKTATDIVNKALKRVNVNSSTQNASASIIKDAREEYLGFHEFLYQELDIRWGSDAVPDKYWTYVAGWFAGVLADVIRTSDENRARAQRAAAMSEKTLRAMISKKPRKTVQMPLV